MSNSVNLIGQKFGKLTVLTSVKKFGHTRQIGWECICDCGNKTTLVGYSLRSGKTKSCGCLKRRYKKENPCFNGYNDISGLFFAHIKHGAKLRKLKFCITLQEIWDLFIQQNKSCALTGLPLRFQSSGLKTDGTASLDRIDSSKGYELGNIQWVHKDINKMKQDFPQDKFVEYCKLVATRFELN